MPSDKEPTRYGFIFAGGQAAGDGGAEEGEARGVHEELPQGPQAPLRLAHPRQLPRPLRLQGPTLNPIPELNPITITFNPSPELKPTPHHPTPHPRAYFANKGDP